MKGIKRTHRAARLATANIGETVTLMGWVQKYRNKGGVIFIDLRDISGIIQIIFDEAECSEETFQLAQTLRNEYVAAITGQVTARLGGQNEKLETGEIEVRASSLAILSRAATPPFPIEENSQTKEELRLKYRYLDLRRPDLQRNLILRSKICAAARNFLINEDFLEIETPILTKSTPEGARDYLVPSRVHQGSFYALPQSPQLFKQLLMCAGYDRYFQIAKCFRDEDLRADRQPEFTQIDMELSFVDVDDVIDVSERLLSAVCEEALGKKVALPIARLTYQEAMRRFGTDKPDTRFGLELVDVSEAVKDCGFGVFSGAISEGGAVRGLAVKNMAGMPRKKLDALGDIAKGYGLKGLAHIALMDDGGVKSPFAKFLTAEELTDIVNAMEGKKGDLLLFAAGDSALVYSVLAALRLELGRDLGLIDESRFEFLWITDFPLFEYSKEEARFVAVHHPFTMPQDEDIPLLDDPARLGEIRAKAYDVVLNGTELGGGSVRIYQSDIQEKVFGILGFTPEDAHLRFGFLLDAFQYGVPPHAGLAFGLDRIVMLFTGAESIRDCMAFPKVKDASCLMTQAPDAVDAGQLAELGIGIVK